MLPPSYIEQVKKATDMLKLAKRYTELKLVGVGVWEGQCPHPKHNDSTPSFRVWEKDQSWACMGCHYGEKDIKNGNYGSDCFAFIQWLERIGWKQAIFKLGDEAGIPRPSEANQRLYDQKEMMTKAMQAGLHGKAYNYLVDRGLTRQDMLSWRIGCDGNKIVFPCMDRYRNVIAFTRRWIEMPEDRNDKYRNSNASPIFDKSCYFYGIHNLDTEFEEIRITEGPMDVILANKYGVRNIVATLGTAFTENHADIIKNLDKIPVFIYDGDDAGLKAIKKAIEMMSNRGVYSKILLIPNDEDLADLSLKLQFNIEDYIQDNSITYGQFKIQNIVNHYESKMNELKIKLYPQMKEVLKEIPEVERNVIRDYISTKLQLYF